MNITDRTFICSFCGDWRTSCSLCRTAPFRVALHYEKDQELAAERELAQIERSIRTEAEKSQETYFGEMK